MANVAVKMDDSPSSEIGEEAEARSPDVEWTATGWEIRGQSANPTPAPLIAFNNIASLKTEKRANELSKRDADAVNYSKSLLDQGDTLVFIKYPNGQRVFDATGFEIRDKHRVHSEKLLATGSAVFKKLLEDNWCQHRAKSRNKLIGKMPDGVKYVLDLTPPNEGDDALELTAELSCPTGILLWHHSVGRLGVSKDLIGGKDETTVRSDHIQERASSSSRAQAVKSVLNGGVGSINPSYAVPKTVDVGGQLDYDPIRHRTGIERLLQVIEGKDPRLDSAPKVWTLAALAKHFDCARVVVDFVVTWIWADPNCRILETLPEDCLRIGMMVQSSRLVRTAFSVLVSEEAMKIGTYHHFKKGEHPSEMTRMGRIHESIDEDALNIIQHAGHQFFTRVDTIVGNLFQRDVAWLHELPSFATLNRKILFDLTHGVKVQGLISKLENELAHYVRGRLLWALIAPLDGSQIKRANEHRYMEAYKKPTVMNVNILYNGLKEKERIMTRFFWETLRDFGWGVGYLNNLHSDFDHGLASVSNYEHMSILEAYGIREVKMVTLVNLVKQFNQQVFDAISENNYNDGIYPPEAFDPMVQQVSSTIPENPGNFTINLEEDDEKSGFWTNHLNFYLAPPHLSTTGESSSSTGQPAALIAAPPFTLPPIQVPSVPMDYKIPISSMFFSLRGFFDEVNDYLLNICGALLYNGENDWSTTCDTLLCLDDEEYKFLPLYAEGLNDGSGGVFEQDIPAAEKGPSGPGPGFHTGSTSGSLSSLADWEGMSDVSTEMAGVDSSLGVEDGHSEDHIDRRVVQSEDDFPLSDIGLLIRGKKDEDDDDDHLEFLNVEEEDDDFYLVDDQD